MIRAIFGLHGMNNLSTPRIITVIPQDLKNSLVEKCELTHRLSVWHRRIWRAGIKTTRLMLYAACADKVNCKNKLEMNVTHCSFTTFNLTFHVSNKPLHPLCILHLLPGFGFFQVCRQRGLNTGSWRGEFGGKRGSSRSDWRSYTDKICTLHHHDQSNLFWMWFELTFDPFLMRNNVAFTCFYLIQGRQDWILKGRK